MDTAIYTPFTKKTLGPDGQTTERIYAVPAFRSTASGWVTTDPTVKAASGPDSVAQAAQSYLPVTFGRSSHQLLQLELPGGGALGFASSGMDLSRPEISSTGVMYRSVYPGVDLRYTNLPTGVKEELVLADPAAATRRFVFELNDTSRALGALTGSDSSGFAFTHRTLDGVGLSLPAPSASAPGTAPGSAGDGSAHLHVQNDKGSRYKVTLSVDKAWLVGKHYPVVLDPTILYNTAQGDVVAYNGSATDSSTLMGNTSVARLRVGNGDWRSYLKFDFNGLKSTDHYGAATLHLQRPLGTAGCYPTTGACGTFAMTLNRLNSAVTGVSTGASGAAAMSTDGPHAIAVPASSGGSYDGINVLPQLQEWLNGTYANYGWGLRATTVPSPGNGVSLFGPSSPGSLATEMPYISVSFMDFYSWATPTAPSSALTNRRLGTATYDWGNNQAIVFGGTSGTSAFDAAGTFFSSALNDTWLYDGTNWTQVNYATSGGVTPAKLVGASMAYDPIAKATFLFGGRDSTGALRSDTYKWDGTKWTLLTPTTSPPARAYASMGFLPVQPASLGGFGGGLYLYGGKTSAGTPGDLWRWNPTSNAWASITQTGTAVPARFGAAVTVHAEGVVGANAIATTYDDSMMIFGGETNSGTKLNDTYELLPTGATSASWTGRTPATAPTARRFASMASSSHQDRDLMTGGQTATGYAADYAQHGLDYNITGGNDWDMSTTNPPAARAESASTFDAKTGEFLVIGGFNGTAVTSSAGAANPGYYAYQMPVFDAPPQTITAPATATRAVGDPFKNVYVPGEPITYTTTATNSGKIPDFVGMINWLPTDVTPIGDPVVTDNGAAVTCGTTNQSVGTRCITLNNQISLINYTLAVGHTLTMINTVTVKPLTTGCTSLLNIGYVSNASYYLMYDRDHTTSADDGVLSYGPPLGQSLTACGGGLGLENWWSYHTTPVAAQSTASVNVANGNLVVQALDATPVQARGHLSYVQRRTYNSQSDPTVTLDGSIGAGWQLNLGEASDLTGLGLDGSQLSIPSLSTDLKQVLHPTSVTLIDRDGTRHVYTLKPNLPIIPIGAGTAARGLNLISGGALSAAAGALNVCLDAAYQAPAGVHLGLWRYVTVPSGKTCDDLSNGATTPTLIGFATERTDRLHAEYNDAGQLTDLYDGAGVNLRYVRTTSPLTDTLTAYEPRTCSDPTPPGTSNTTCRALRYTQTRSLSDPHVSTTVLDPANRTTEYDSYNTGLVTVLDRVLNPNNAAPSFNPAGLTDYDSVLYTYSGDAHAVGTQPDDDPANVASAEYARRWTCSATGHQLCSIKDARGHRTYFHYTTGTGLTGAGEGTLDSLTDRRGTLTTFAYTPSIGYGATTTVITDPNGATPHQQAYTGIDAFDRTTVMKAGPVGDATQSSYPALNETDYAWDSDFGQTGGSWCTNFVAVTTRQNNLCTLTRKGSNNSSSTGVATPDQVTGYYYDDSGLPFISSQQLGGSGGTPLQTTTAYRRQWVTNSGITVVDQSTSGNGAIGTTGAPPAINTTLYTLADRLQALTARGNAAGAVVANYTTNYTIDAPPAGATTARNPNAVPTGTTCPATVGNTGLVCSITVPLDLNGTGGALRTAVTSYSYDTYGAKLTMTRPEGGQYSYAYNTAGSYDLTSSTQADGWLARVTDPKGNFVAFAYDPASDVARTWDRDATSKAPGLDYTATLAASPANYSAALYGTGTAGTAAGYSNPWRYQLTGADPLGDTVASSYDQNGNALTVTSGRGNITRQTFDSGDLLQTTEKPAEHSLGGQTATTFVYDVFGNRIRSAEPNASATSDPTNPKATAYTYDTINRPTRMDRGRDNNTSSTPSGCVNNASRAYAPTLPADVVCSSSIVYDTVGNTIRSNDFSGQNTDSSFDDLRRLLARTTPVHGGTAPQTRYLYDADSNTIALCQPLLVGACTTGTVDATHSYPQTIQSTYDFADRLVNRSTFREATSTYTDSSYTPVTSTTGYVGLTTTKLYDRDSNVTEVRDPQYGIDSSRKTLTTYDSLDRPISVQRPPHGTATGLAAGSPTTAYRQYSPSGDLLADIQPGAATDNINTSTRLTGYHYDAAHRRTDQVKALQLSATITSPPTFDATALDAAVLAGTTSGTSGNNQHTRWRYDADNQVTDTWQPRGFTTTGTVDDSFHTHTAYDADDRAQSTLTPRFTDTGATTDPVTGVTTDQGTQCPAGVTGYPSGTHVCTTGYGYDSTGNITTTTLPTTDSSHTNRYLTTAHSYDDLATSTTSPDPSASATSAARITAGNTSYDGAGRVVAQTDALGHTTSTLRYPDGLPETVTTPPGTVASQRGTGTLSHTTSYAYDLNGNNTIMVQPVTLDNDWGSGNSGTQVVTYNYTTTVYTADNLTSAITAPASAAGATSLTNITTYGYDYAGNTARVKSPLAYVATTTSSPFKSTSNALQTINQYWPDNTLKTTLQPVIADAGAGDQFRRTRYAYDDAARKITQGVDQPTATAALLTDNSALTGTQSFSYYPNDLLNVETGRGVTPETISHEYDATGNQVTVKDTPSGGAAFTTSMSWYLDGLPRTSSQSSRTSGYSYNGNGQLLARADTAGSTNTATFTYGDADQLTQFHDALLDPTNDTAVANDQLGRLVTETVPSTPALVASWTYNADNTLGQHKVANGGTTLAQQTYSYDELSRQLTQTYTGTDNPTGITSTYTYNRSGTVKTYRNGSTATIQNATWDNNNSRLTWNPTAAPTSTQTWTYRADNAIKTGPSSGTDTTSHTYSYDALGNQTGDGCHTLTPDGFDRTSQRGAGTGGVCGTSPIVTYTYDGLDRQVTHTDGVGGPVTTEYYDGPSSTLQAEATTGTVNGGTTVYALDNHDTSLGLSRTNTSGDSKPPPTGSQRLYDDGQGNFATTTTLGVSTCQNRYDPFGSPADGTSLTGCTTNTAPLPLTADTLGYGSNRRDTNTGSYQLGSRTYDPAKASFTSPDGYRNSDPSASAGIISDPLTANTYGYVNGDPINFIDPTGHFRCSSQDRIDGACAEVGMTAASANFWWLFRKTEQANYAADEAQRQKEAIGVAAQSAPSFVNGRCDTNCAAVNDWENHYWNVNHCQSSALSAFLHSACHISKKDLDQKWLDAVQAAQNKAEHDLDDLVRQLSAGAGLGPGAPQGSGLSRPASDYGQYFGNATENAEQALLRQAGLTDEAPWTADALRASGATRANLENDALFYEGIAAKAEARGNANSAAVAGYRAALFRQFLSTLGG